MEYNNNNNYLYKYKKYKKKYKAMLQKGGDYSTADKAYYIAKNMYNKAKKKAYEEYYKKKNENELLYIKEYVYVTDDEAKIINDNILKFIKATLIFENAKFNFDGEAKAHMRYNNAHSAVRKAKKELGKNGYNLALDRLEEVKKTLDVNNKYSNALDVDLNALNVDNEYLEALKAFWVTILKYNDVPQENNKERQIYNTAFENFERVSLIQRKTNVEEDAFKTAYNNYITAHEIYNNNRKENAKIRK